MMKKNKMSMIGHIVFGLGMITIGLILGTAIQHNICPPCDCPETIKQDSVPPPPGIVK